MRAHTLYILGDSGSMTLGIEKECYVNRLADAPLWQEHTAFLNGSQPGITSADACAFFFHSLRHGSSPSGAVIYLGNCDAMNSEVHKGKYTPFRQFKHAVNRWLGRKATRTRLKNRLHHYAWDSGYNRSLERPEEPEEFRYNLGRIIEKCRELSVPVVLVRPKANPLFPAGLGKGNFAFYRFVGINDSFSRSLTDRQPLAQALALHEAGEWETAMMRYRELMDAVPSTEDPEYPLVLLNNYAAAAAELGRVDEAIFLFRQLLQERRARREIILYNLSRTVRDPEQAKDLLKEATEADTTMYRIRTPYIEAIDALAQRFPDTVRLVDLHAIAADTCFADHCHLLPEGQAQLAAAIAQSFEGTAVQGVHSARIDLKMHNPELSLGNQEEFFSYYRTFTSFSEAEVASHLAMARRMLQRTPGNAPAEILDGFIPRELSTALKLWLRHPCFPTALDALDASPLAPSDIGRFPEMFLWRHLIPYLRAVQEEPGLAGLLLGCAQLMRRPEDLLGLLPDRARTYVRPARPEASPEQGLELARRILAATRRCVQEHVASGVQVHDRLKSTIYWYFRETLRFGPHSRISMRYDRITLEYCAEALAVAAVAANGDAVLHDEVRGLAELLGMIVDIHERHCRRFALAKTDAETLGAYATELQALSTRLGVNKHETRPPCPEDAP